MAHVDVTPSDCEREVRAVLDLVELAGNAKNRLVRHDGSFELPASTDSKGERMV